MLGPVVRRIPSRARAGVVKDNPRPHRGVVTWSQQKGVTMQVWSCRSGKGRAYYVAVVDPDGHTLVQGKFVVAGRAS